MKRSFVWKVLSLIIVIGNTEVLAAQEGKIRIGLYGYGGDYQISELYQKEAIELGEFLSKQKIVPISGCLTEEGNLHKVIESCMKNGGVVDGVVDVASPFPVKGLVNGHKNYVLNYGQVKKHMFNKGKAFIVLPCGIGGLGAALDILCLKEKGAHHKPIYFYNEQFWRPILLKLEEMVGPLPEYHIINAGSEIADLSKVDNTTNKEIVDQFYAQQHKARHSDSVSRFSSLSKPKISLELINDILEVYLARIDGIHNKSIVVNGAVPTSENESIVFDISSKPLKDIFDHMHQEGFIKPDHLNMIQFNTDTE